MDPITPYSLESFTERHRADFDLHEPRPELWDALEKQLDAEAPAKHDYPFMSVAASTPTEPATLPTAEPAAAPVLRAQRPRARWQRLGIGLTLAALLLAVSLGGRWLQRAPVAAEPAVAAEPGLYVGTSSTVVPASEGGPDSNARLDTAVHGMERYYASQLADRQAQLSQLAPSEAADWQQQLIGLDSSYQQLKRELPRHPQPEVVLTAMNRNLQIRLDILDQQLQVRGASQVAQGAATSTEYALADSRSFADHASPHHEMR